MKSETTTVEAYLDGVEPSRQDAIRAVHQTVHDAMPEGYEEDIAWGMITWTVSLDRFPDTYNGQPLCYVGLAAQKNYNSLYLMALYSDSDEDRAFRDRWAAGGRKLNMGKSCLRFTSLADVDLDLVAETVAGTPVDQFLSTYERLRAR